jgi:hypothetical protein
LPDDPFMGKPFCDERRDRTAHLRGTPPPGLEKVAPFNLHIELIVTKGLGR